MCPLPREVVPTQTLDNMVREHGVARLDVVKLDLERMEHRVSNRAQEALRRYRPFILFEVAVAALRGQGTSASKHCAALLPWAIDFAFLPTKRDSRSRLSRGGSATTWWLCRLSGDFQTPCFS